MGRVLIPIEKATRKFPEGEICLPLLTFQLLLLPRVLCWSGWLSGDRICYDFSRSYSLSLSVDQKSYYNKKICKRNKEKVMRTLAQDAVPTVSVLRNRSGLTSSPVLGNTFFSPQNQHDWHSPHLTWTMVLFSSRSEFTQATYIPDLLK